MKIRNGGGIHGSERYWTKRSNEPTSGWWINGELSDWNQGRDTSVCWDLQLTGSCFLQYVCSIAFKTQRRWTVSNNF